MWVQTLFNLFIFQTMLRTILPILILGNLLQSKASNDTSEKCSLVSKNVFSEPSINQTISPPLEINMNYKTHMYCISAFSLVYIIFISFIIYYYFQLKILHNSASQLNYMV